MTVCRVEAESNDVEAYRALRAKLWPMSPRRTAARHRSNSQSVERGRCFWRATITETSSGSWKCGCENMQTVHLHHPSVF